MRRKKQEPLELEDSDGEFAAVFSDLMSFLAGLFILLFTIVNTQKNTPQYFAEMSIKFGGKVVEQEQTVTTEDLFVSDIKKYITEEEISQYALVLVDEQKIRLIFNDPILFQSGTDVLTKTSKAVLNGLIHIINQVKHPIIIEGHTDDIPVSKDSSFRSNWDLAYFRASAVAGYLMSKGVKESRMAIMSYADQKPLARKKTYLARKKNRRIEINIIRLKEKT